MIGIPISNNNTSDSELQIRNSQDNQRVFDPSAYFVLSEILKETKKVYKQLEIITGEEL